MEPPTIQVTPSYGMWIIYGLRNYIMSMKWYIYYAAGRPRARQTPINTNVAVYLGQRPMINGRMGRRGCFILATIIKGVPTLDNTNYAIDLGVFRLNGQLFAVWSGNAGAVTMALYCNHGKPYTISSSRSVISKPDKTWGLYTEKLNEGPAFLKTKRKVNSLSFTPATDRGQTVSPRLYRT